MNKQTALITDLVERSSAGKRNTQGGGDINLYFYSTMTSRDTFQIKTV